MGRPRTGSVEGRARADGTAHFTARVWLGDGTRERVAVPEKYLEPRTGETLRECAELFAKVAQEREDETGELLAKKRERQGAAKRTDDAASGESCDEWYARYDTYHRECGYTDPTGSTRWKKWVSPRIGAKPIALVSRDDVEDIRDVLDLAIQAWAPEAGRGKGEVSGRTAMNVWSALTSAFKAATNSKRRDLRVLTINPCVGVEPPGDRNSRKARRKTFVYPKECGTLLECERIPLDWREVHAIAAYTYLRPGELRVLTWGDVDMAARLINVTKAWDYYEGAIKKPKTSNGVRRLPIEPTLLPLLERMGAGRDAGDLVVPVMSTVPENTLAEMFRAHLILAGVKRAELHRDTSTHVQANFRSWRDSGLTWLSMSGLGVDKLMRRAGHDTVQTSMTYVKQAEDFTGDLGIPFEVLPDELIRGASGRRSDPGLGHRLGQPGSKPAKSWRRARDSNPVAGAGPTRIQDVGGPDESSGDDSSTRTQDPFRLNPPDLARVIALAVAVESMSAGHARVLATELRKELEAMHVPVANVRPILTKRR